MDQGQYGGASFTSFNQFSHHVCKLFAGHLLGGQCGHLRPCRDDVQAKDSLGVVVLAPADGLQMVTVVGQQCLESVGCCQALGLGRFALRLIFGGQ